MEPVPPTDPAQPRQPVLPSDPAQRRQSVLPSDAAQPRQPLSFADSARPHPPGTPEPTAATMGASEPTSADKPEISDGRAAEGAETTAGSVRRESDVEESALHGTAAISDAAGGGGAEAGGAGIRGEHGAESGGAGAPGGTRAAAEERLGTVDGEPEELVDVPRLKRGQERSPRDMALSLAVLIVPIVLLLIFYRVVLSGDAPVTVDPGPTIEEAQRAAVFTVAAPQGLGDDWHASSATFQRQASGATLRIGYVDPDKDPVQLVESSIPPATLLPAELGDSAKALGNFRTPAGVWHVYDGRPAEKALVLAEPTRTIIVLGKTDITNLEKLATSLK